MRLNLRVFFIAGALSAFLLAAASTSYASTILKLNLGGVGPDIAMNGLGILGTVSDGDNLTNGDQNTAIEFTSFLDDLTDVITPVASFTLSGLQTIGPATVSPPVVIQNFQGGTLNLYDAGNTLLLSGLLTDSVLTGVLGSPATGGLFTTSVATVTGGTLQPRILPNTLGVSITLSDVNDGLGFSVGVAAPILNPFEADGFVNISGEPDPNGNIPEPASAALVVLAAVCLMQARRRS